MFANEQPRSSHARYEPITHGQSKQCDFRFNETIHFGLQVSGFKLETDIYFDVK